MVPDATRVRIDHAAIESRQFSEISLMPEGLHESLTEEEFADLIEYLVNLKQPANASMVQHGMPAVIGALSPPVALQPFHEAKLDFQHPVWMGSLAGVADTFLVVEHETGRIWRLHKSERGESKSIFAEMGQYTKGTRGLLGVVLHPRFPENGKYYYAQHVIEEGRFVTVIAEREAGPEKTADSGRAARRLLTLEGTSNVHYGGGLAFGPDGFLYVGMGDSGPQEDPHGNGQNSGLLLGKMLRIDPDHPTIDRPYTIPADNPFLGQAGVRPEVWALGFREPWRFSFDPVTGDLWVGDVGQDRYEEIDLVRPGENYGWNVYEGFEPFSNQYRHTGAAYVAPVFAYGRRYGPSVTGGFVYRANPQSSFYGAYVFGDYESRRIWGMTQENRRLKTIRQIGIAPQRIVSFGTDLRGNIYVVGYEGMIYRIDFSPAVFE